jgi:hypothetical protein
MKNTTFFLIVILTYVSPLKAQVFSSTSIAPFNTANFYSRVIDFDNDGDDDIYGFSYPSTALNSTKIYRNNGNSTFTDVSVSLNFPSYDGGICADLDKNGYMDMYYLNGDTMRYSLNNGTTFSTPSATCGYVLFSTLFNTPYSNIKSYKLGDFNNDGIYDVVAQIVNGANSAIYGKQGQLNCTGCLFSFGSNPAVSLITLVGTALTQVQFNDIDNDSDFDMLTNQGGNQYANVNYAIYLNNAGSFSLLSGSGYTVGRMNGFGISGEFNNDGKSDIISGAPDCCVTGNPLYVYFSNSSSTSFTASTTAMTRVNNPYYNIASIYDINLDKKQDIVWTSIAATGSEALQCFLNNGNNTFTESAASLGINYGPSAGICCPIQNYMEATMIDFNNDKKPDIDIHERDIVAPYTVVNSYQRLNTSTNNAVKIKLIACTGLREGWGARVSYKCGGTWSYQQHTSYTGVNYPFLYLGMSTSTVIDSLVVNWMGGATSVLTNVVAGNYQVISENLNCSNTGGSISATVNASGPTSFCQGANVTLTASSGSGLSYQWKNNGININGATSNTYIATSTGVFSVTITNSSGCAATSSGITVTVYVLPTVNAGPDQSICAGSTATLTGSGAATYSWNNGVSNGSAFTPASTSTYTVTGTSPQGCTATDQVIVTLNTLPTVNAGPDQSICAGSTATLTGTGAATYSWDNGISNGTAFTPASTSAYTVTGTSAQGCTATDQVIVTVNALPSVNAGTDQSICAGNSVTLSGAGANTYSWNNGVSNGSAFTPNSTSTYTVTGTSAQGCTATDQVIVTVDVLPSVNAGPDQSICAGSTTSLSGSGAATYSWDNGIVNGVAFSPNTTSTYTVVGTAPNGCTGSDQVVINVNQTPSVNAGPDQAICEGTAVTLSGSGATTYSWSNAITNGVAFVPVFTNTYTVTGTNADGCSNTDQVTVVVNENGFVTIDETAMDSYTLNGQTYTQSGTYIQVIPTLAGCDSTITLNLTLSFTGLSELEKGINMYPNPTHDVLHLEGIEILGLSYTIFDATGRLVLQGKFEHQELYVNTLQPGTYTLQLENTTKPLRFVKE